jgi:hypothetical protein
MSALVLVQALRDPASVTGLDMAGWNGLIAMARAEQLIGSLAYRFDGLALPADVERMLLDARRHATFVRRQALWEADRARVALAGIDAPVILLKGTAYVAAGLRAGVGRHIGDLDIMVPRPALERVEKALISAGWEWVKPDPYDDAYYRQWMHELPPLIHRERDRMIDVHHTILPLTARPKPDAAAMIADSVVLENGLRVLTPNDMICHAAAHLMADGDLAGGMRNLWDIHCLIEQFGVMGLTERALHHGLWSAVARAAAHANRLYGTAIPDSWHLWDSVDPLFHARILARDGWGRPARPLLRLAFYVRSHWLRMPPTMLARHLFTKWRKR